MLTKYLVCATRVIRDGEENKVSAIDIVENFTSSVFPLVFPRFSVLWVVDKESGDNDSYPCKLKFTLNEKELGVFDSSINFQGADSTRVALVIGGLALPTPGSLVVSAEVGGVSKAQYQVKIGGVPAPIGRVNPQGGALM